jgi:S1-C subfamily serine protease
MLRKLLIVFVLLFTSAGAQVADNSVQDKIFKARDKVMPALVHIQPVIKDYNTGELKKQAVIGSGVIFHADGYVVTNYHVAGKAERTKNRSRRNTSAVTRPPISPW